MSSSNYRSARDFVGQKVVVVGACSAGKRLTYVSGSALAADTILGHDIASDCAGLGIGRLISHTSKVPSTAESRIYALFTSQDVTIVQRSSTYVFSIENGVLPGTSPPDSFGDAHVNLVVAKTSVTKFTIEEFDRRENSLPVEFMKPVAQRRAVELYKADR